MTEHAVVIAGGGPTGMMLAGELALAGIDVVIVERRASQDLDSSRARGLHSRTIEVLDQRGIADRFLAEGQAMQIQSFARIPLDISDFPTRHNYGLALLQIHFERILAAWVSEVGVPIAREREVTGFAPDDTGVDVELSRPARRRVGAPGSRRRRGARGRVGSPRRVRRLGGRPPGPRAASSAHDLVRSGHLDAAATSGPPGCATVLPAPGPPDLRLAC
jgi:2-polyprenyl-6-methoxyphenol hydroxylase-like FAD-dependent oxidoreductase